MMIMIDICCAASLVFGWGYRASDQRRWAVQYPACGGRQQSPIAISARQAIPISIPAMELIGYQNPLPGPLTITNNGHTGNILFHSLFLQSANYTLWTWYRFYLLGISADIELQVYSMMCC
jgi:carbonic anhydrase